jgi:hypothetical protein
LPAVQVTRDTPHDLTQVAGWFAGFESDFLLRKRDEISAGILGDRVESVIARVHLNVHSETSRLFAQDVDRGRADHAVAIVGDDDEVDLGDELLEHITQVLGFPLRRLFVHHVDLEQLLERIGLDEAPLNQGWAPSMMRNPRDPAPACSGSGLRAILSRAVTSRRLPQHDATWLGTPASRR